MSTPVDREAFERDGWCIARGALTPEVVEALDTWVDEIAGWAAAGAPGLHHWESTSGTPTLARSEDLVPHHDGLRRLVCDHLGATAAHLFGEAAVLFKEKVNHKRPGGAGFAAHQDATAYRFVDHHISAMVPVDPATVDSGCLWVARPHTPGEILPNDAGRIDADVVAGLEWEPIEVVPGDIVWFDSYLPHRSDTNTTPRARRVLYLTYNAASAGDHRGTYYADKQAELAARGETFGGERVRMSINDDFLGRPVAAPGPRTGQP